MSRAQKRLVFALSIIGALGLGMLVAWTRSEPYMFCYKRTVPWSGERPGLTYSICEVR